MIYPSIMLEQRYLVLKQQYSDSNDKVQYFNLHKIILISQDFKKTIVIFLQFGTQRKVLFIFSRLFNVRVERNQQIGPIFLFPSRVWSFHCQIQFPSPSFSDLSLSHIHTVSTCIVYIRMQYERHKPKPTFPCQFSLKLGNFSVRYSQTIMWRFQYYSGFFTNFSTLPMIFKNIKRHYSIQHSKYHLLNESIYFIREQISFYSLLHWCNINVINTITCTIVQELETINIIMKRKKETFWQGKGQRAKSFQLKWMSSLLQFSPKGSKIDLFS